jgi:hypothetical protein
MRFCRLLFISGFYGQTDYQNVSVQIPKKTLWNRKYHHENQRDQGSFLTYSRVNLHYKCGDEI